MEKICIVGGGNVASHLLKAFEGKADVCMANPRSLDGLPQHPRIILISVKDDAIADVARRLKGKADIIAHTSGSVPMEVLAGCAPGTGVFYPLQTFTKGTEMTYSDIPFFIEGSDTDTRDTLASLARLISPEIHLADSAARKRLHLASVFACNFSNCLMGIADDILEADGMDYKVLLPLMRQTLAKLDSLSPSRAQTGPAARRDTKVMEAHEEMLASDVRLKDIYHILSLIIMDKSK